MLLVKSAPQSFPRIAKHWQNGSEEILNYLSV